MSNGRINGKQIIDDTVVKSINGLTFSDQYIITNNDSNITLNVATSGSTHSFTVGWTGTLPISRGGLGNTSFTASQILILGTNSVISSGYKFNDGGTSSTDIWSADKIITQTSQFATGSGITNSIAYWIDTKSLSSSVNLRFDGTYLTFSGNNLIVSTTFSTSVIRSTSSGGLSIYSNGGSQIMNLGAGGGQNATLFGPISMNSTNKIINLATGSNALDATNYNQMTEYTHAIGIIMGF